MPLTTKTTETETSQQNLVRLEDGDGWRWYTDEEGQKYISVTQVLDVAMHFRLKKWLANTSVKKAKETKYKTANLGTRFHNMVERDLTGQHVVCPAELKMPYENWQKLKSEKNIKAFKTEQMVNSTVYGYAGSLDIFGTFEDRACIMDIKTGRYDVKAGWQLAAYRQAFLEGSGYKKEELGMVGLQVHREGKDVNTFVYEHIDFCFERFLCCLEIFKGLYFYKLNKMKWPWLQHRSLGEHYQVDLGDKS